MRQRQIDVEPYGSEDLTDDDLPEEEDISESMEEGRERVEKSIQSGIQSGTVAKSRGMTLRSHNGLRGKECSVCVFMGIVMSSFTSCLTVFILVFCH